MKKMKTLEFIKLIRDVQKHNPYPAEVFTEPTPEQYKKFNKFLKAKGLSPDGYNGTTSRWTWNNCCEKIIERISEYENNE